LAPASCKASEQRSHSVADRRWRRACILKISEPGFLGLYTMMFGIGGALGPILAGELVQHFGWPRGVLVSRACRFAGVRVHLDLAAHHPTRPATFRCPWAALLVLAITFLLLTLNQLRALEQSPWGCIAAGCITY